MCHVAFLSKLINYRDAARPKTGVLMKVLIPTPANEFDPSEVAVTWKLLKQNGIQITFATPEGKTSQADSRMLTGQSLGLWKQILSADANALRAYNEMLQSSEFQNPIKWSEAKESQYSAIVLPGGHAPGMKEYLESPVLQNLIAEFFSRNKLVGAICHGVVLAARSKHQDGTSVLKDYKVTALLRTQELTAWALTCLWLKDYYRTYPETVQSEVMRSLSDPKHFYPGPTPLMRDSPENLNPGFVVEDRNLITARWPGDAHRFGKRIAERLLLPRENGTPTIG